MKLGLLYKDGKIVNHRSLIKVILNPILRYFGWQIATIINENETPGKVCFMKCEKSKTISYDFDNHNPFDLIVKRRLII